MAVDRASNHDLKILMRPIGFLPGKLVEVFRVNEKLDGSLGIVGSDARSHQQQVAGIRPK